jgi:6-phosphogluconolactonase
MKFSARPTVLLILACLCLPAAAQQYIVTNDNAFGSINSATVLKVSTTGQMKVLQTYPTGGPSAGGAFFALMGVASARVGTNTCVFVSNGGNSTIAAFTLNTTTGVLTAVAGSPFSYGASGAQTSGVGLAVAANKFLYAGNSISTSISAIRINSTCALKGLKTYSVAGPPDGLKVTPNGKFLIAAYLGQVDSFQINATTGALTELGPIAAQGTSAGVEISCDSTTAYIGDAASNIQVEVYSISSSGQLSLLNNFTDSSGVNSNNVVLSPDGSTLYVSNTMSAQITALTTSAGGGLTFGNIVTVNGSPSFVLNLAFGKNGKNLFLSEVASEEEAGSFTASGTTLTEVTGSPFNVINNGGDAGSFATIPGKVCQ